MGLLYKPCTCECVGLSGGGGGEVVKLNKVYTE